MLPRSQTLNGHCCQGRARPTSTRRQRGWDVVVGALSLGVWMITPKCPVCLAAHLALWTGLGLSLTAASYLRGAMLLLSGILLGSIVVRRIARGRTHRLNAA